MNTNENMKKGNDNNLIQQDCIIRPQDNFYQHVNNKWLNDPENNIPGEYPSWGGFIKLLDTSLNNQIKLVKDLIIQDNLSKEEMKIAAIWQGCMNTFDNWKNGNGNYDPITKEFAILEQSFINTDEQNISIKMADYLFHTQMNGIINMFDFDKGNDMMNSNNIVLDITTGGLSLPSREYYFDDNFKEKRDMFREHLIKVGHILYLNDDFADNVITFENIIAKCKMTQEQKRKYDKYYTNTTLINLYEKINELISLPEKQENYALDERNFILNKTQVDLASVFFERLYELFNFRSIMAENLNKNFINPKESLLNNKNIIDPPIKDHITAYDGDAIRHYIAIIFDSNNLNKYISFMQYKIISSLQLFCTKELNDEFFDFYNNKLNGQTKQKSDEKRAIQIVNNYAGEMLGSVYVKHYFPEKYKKNIYSMIMNIIDVMRMSIKDNDWMTNITKEKALNKLNKFNVKIGYPDVWKDYSDFNVEIGDTLYDISKKAHIWALKVNFFNKLNSVVDKNEWLMTPQTVNAYFMPPMNEIVFPAAILQPPFYCKNFVDIDFDITSEQNMLDNDENNENKYEYFVEAANFGGIGAVIAHEITHGYDDSGRKYDGDGNLVDWWTEEDSKSFNEKTQLMTDQTNKYIFIDDSGKEYKINDQLTMGENLADLGGMSLALQTMKKIFNERKMPQKMIDIAQRIMFKAFANIWKENTKTDYKINTLTTDPHSPSDFRANLVSNMNEFYDAFDVKEADNMYIAPDKRLRMW